MKIHTEPDLQWYMDFFGQPVMFLITEKTPVINMMSQECVNEKSGHRQYQTSS